MSCRLSSEIFINKTNVVFIRANISQAHEVKPMGEEIITRPLYAALALLVLFIVIPVFAGISTVGTAASAGLMSMSTTLADFTPVYGIGLAIGMIMMFLALATILKRGV